MLRIVLHCSPPRARPVLAGCFLLALLTPLSLAQQRYKMIYQTGTMEGELLELIEHQIDTNRKIEQMERFLQRYPTHPAVSHLIEWLQMVHLRAGLYDRSIEYGERLLARHPDDYDTALRCQRAAEQKQDQALIHKWNERVLALSEKLVKSSQPKDLDGQTWKQSLEIAQAVLAQREYEEFTMAAEAASPRAQVHLFEEFLRKHPNSGYTPQVWPYLMNANHSLGDSAKALAAADHILEKDPNELDALLFSSQILLERKSNFSKIIANATRVLEIVPARRKPETLSEKEWEKRKAYYLGSAYLLLGNAHVNQNSYASADKNLRASLQYLRGSDQTEAAILFYLGWANYHMENYREAAGFFRQCMAMAGPFREQAVRNLTVMRTERRSIE
ncbi:MAG: tetratricopeptide repeat protein [Acidobacteria bacterium]|nr:tetratricopeptide repeat protein [Acidobacteriota bacterium]